MIIFPKHGRVTTKKTFIGTFKALMEKCYYDPGCSCLAVLFYKNRNIIPIWLQKSGNFTLPFALNQFVPLHSPWSRVWHLALQKGNGRELTSEHTPECSLFLLMILYNAKIHRTWNLPLEPFFKCHISVI